MLAVSVVGYGALAWMSIGLIARPGLRAVTPDAIFFAALAVLVGLSPVPLFRGATVTVGFAVDCASLLIFGPAIAAWIGVASYLVLLRRSPLLRQTFNHAQLVLSMLAAGWQAYQTFHRGRRPITLERPLPHRGVVRSSLSPGISASSSPCDGALGAPPGVGDVGVSFRWALIAISPWLLRPVALVYRTEGTGMGAVALFSYLVGARHAFRAMACSSASGNGASAVAAAGSLRPRDHWED
jgi:hypothetical protein